MKHKGHDAKHHSAHMSADGRGEGMAHKGDAQGDMSPHVKDFQKPMSDFSQAGFSKTLDYVERQDRFQGKEASEIKSQDYKGRYS